MNTAINNNALVLNRTSLAFLRASGVCTLLFFPTHKDQRMEKKQRANVFYNFFVALKNPKLLVQTLNICANTTKKQKDNKTAASPPSYC